ncbi:MAG: FAD-binding protein [bacterium]|nr:FAD-binding protein [bacterium]
MEIKKNVSLAELTTFKIGGKARYFCAVQSVPDLKKAVSFAKDKKLDFLVLGGGSNVLMRDGVLEGVVVKMEIKGMEYTGAISQSLRKKENVASGGEKQSPELKKTQSVSETRVFVRVGAGEWWDGFARNVAKRGLWGVENLSGIPGTVGAAPIQNIGAYGQEVDDTVVSVETLNTETLEERRFSNKQCRFGYRDSFFKTKEGKKYIITAVTFALRKDGKPNVSYQDIKKKIEDLGITIQGLSPMKMRQMVVEIR